MNRNPLPSHLRRVGIAAAVAAALLLLPLPASAGFIWNLGAAVGYGSLVFTVALYVYPLRGDGVPHRRLFTVSQHRRIGWIALILAGVHTAILLAAEPLTGHYLLPSAPLYMLCGLVALIALGVLVPTGIAARSILRKAAPPRVAPSNVVAHSILAALLLGLLGAHIIGSGQLLDQPAKVITCCALLFLALFYSAWRPRAAPLRTRLLSTVIPSCIALAGLSLMPTPLGGMRLLQPATMPAVLHAYFPHENHRTVACITCHHNFVDKTGAGSCYVCHRGPRPDLPRAAEATFHVLCRDCHRELALQGAKHGPVRECSGCHIEKPASEAVLSNNPAICQTCCNASPTLCASQAADQRSRVDQAADWGFR